MFFAVEIFIIHLDFVNKEFYMTNLMEIYKCEICGNIVEILYPGYGTLVCCSQPMVHLAEHNNDDSAQEKHVPVLIKENGEMTIRVGSLPHPMEPEHYIMFIEAISPDKVWMKRKYLKPKEEPSLKFGNDGDKMIARELCNIHGLWSKNYD